MPKFEHVHKSFGMVRVFSDFCFEFPENKITAVLGPSGCGKTTLLNLLAGLKSVDQGSVSQTTLVSYLFQEPRLLPWLTVRANIALVLKEKAAPAEILQRIDRHLERMGLLEYADHFPAQISGGMRQRVAMARAFSYEAPLLLMDEPFKSLDIKMRFQLVQDFLALWQQAPRTVVMVTHDIQEALWLADRVVVLSNKPARIVFSLDLDAPHDRQNRAAGLLDIEKKLTDLLLA